MVLFISGIAGVVLSLLGFIGARDKIGEYFHVGCLAMWVCAIVCSYIWLI